MSALNIYLFLHIAGAFLLAGGALLGEIVNAALRRSTRTSAILALLAAATRIPMLTITGALLTLIFGTLLVFEFDYSFGAMWINAAFLLWFVAVGLSIAVLTPAERAMHDLATREASAGREESAELIAAVRAPKFRVTVHALSALVVVFLYLMVFKPGN